MWNLLESCKHNHFAGADSSGFWTFHPTYVEVLQHFGMAGKFKEVTAQPVACPTSLSDDALLKRSVERIKPHDARPMAAKSGEDRRQSHLMACDTSDFACAALQQQPRTAQQPRPVLQPHSVRSRTCRILASDRSQSSSP